ncbi:MAG: amino acid adenylation domain-containing protein, partial [bacterium]|nr:amino acid adenylation domain-containing protein [bacterium]
LKELNELDELKELDEFGEGIEVIDLHSIYKTPSTESLSPAPGSASSLAYAIYTSGSTGKPKGTLTSHQNVVNVALDPQYVNICPKDRILQLSNYAFDGSIFDIFGALLNGATLVMMPGNQAAMLENLVRNLWDEKITVFFLTTALFNTLVDLEIQCLRNTRKILFGGEQVSPTHVRKALQYLGKDRILHMYGPTETTVYATYYPINEVAENTLTVPIGRQVANTTLYVTDKTGTPVPIGVPGELLIGGDGVARGYLNQPELTAERFIEAGPQLEVSNNQSIPNNQYPITNTHLYRTGDLVKWQPDGNIEFLGRIDHQVKIRGFRIEMGEIENLLSSQNDIKETVVLAKKDKENNSYLIAYYVPENMETEQQTPSTISQLRTFLAAKLPAYMVPSHLVPLEKFPLTPNGKIDRKALPEPGETPGISTEYQAPATETEIKLAALWQEILEIEQIGIMDNFFEIGGHSLKAINLISKIKKTFQVELPVTMLFENPQIKTQAQYILQTGKSLFAAVETVEKREYYPVAAAQKRMYILNRFTTDNVNYNIPAALIIKGDLSKTHFEEAFQKILQRHESLRTTFHYIDDEPVQRIHDHGETEFNVKYSTQSNREEISRSSKTYLEAFLRPFTLSQAPLIRAELVQGETNEHLFLIDMHHIISDGVSMDIFVNEFSQLYAGMQLEKPTVQYKDFA